VRLSSRVQKVVVFVGEKIGPVFHPHGTAFIAISPIDSHPDLGWQALVTCRHVIEGIGSDTVTVRINDEGGHAELIPLPKKNWIPHENPKIDVSVCPVLLPRDQFDILHVGMDHDLLARGDLRDEGVNAGDEVFFSGMFTRRLGDKGNIPIVRCGTIAALLQEEIETEYGFHEAFLIEARSVSGLSGSPVYVYYSQRPENLAAGGAETHLVMGMILGTSLAHDPRDYVEIQQPKVPEPHDGAPKSKYAAIPLNTGLAVVLPIWLIKEAINQPRVRSMSEDNLLRPVPRHRRQANVLSIST
jgi:hypothetical protein